MSRVVLSVLAIGLLISLASAVAQSRDPNNRPPILSTVTKNDGSTVRGSIVSSDPDTLTIQPPAKAGEEVEPVVISWDDVRKVSNGLTREKAWARWKEENRDKLCDDCKGDRAVRCDVCKGVGHDPAASADCAACKGEMVVECKNSKCDEGKMPCPAPCLKLTEGRWFERDGKKWRRIAGPGGGSLEVSDSHLGEVWKVTRDGPVNEGKCTRCGGTTIADCVDCEATGKQVCKLCQNRRDAPECPAAECDAGRTPCITCEHTGLKKT